MDTQEEKTTNQEQTAELGVTFITTFANLFFWFFSIVFGIFFIFIMIPLGHKWGGLSSLMSVLLINPLFIKYTIKRSIKAEEEPFTAGQYIFCSFSCFAIALYTYVASI